MSQAFTLAVLGGSGLYEMESMVDVTEIDVDTPFGPPSDRIVKGRLKGTDTTLLFLPRHGKGHRIPPHQINYRANVCALKKAGATHLVSISAVGSMREEIVPGHLVVPDQFIDLTKKRTTTFFEDGVAAHVVFADPVCELMAGALANAATAAAAQGKSDIQIHRGGTYVVMEGPQFSTRAESLLYRSWKVSVIGMTGMPEAKLAREAELPFALLALATDYDCWHESEEDVSVDAVLAVIKRNVDVAKRTIAELARSLPDPTKSRAHQALKNAVMTAPDRMTPESRARLGWLLNPYLGK